MTAVGDPALVGKVDGSTVGLAVAPEASTRDETCALGLAALVAKAFFGGVVTVLPIAVDVAAVATLVGAIEKSIGPGFMLLSPEAPALAGREGLGCLTVRAPVSVTTDFGWATSSRSLPVAVAAAPSHVVTAEAKASFGGMVATLPVA